MGKRLALLVGIDLYLSDGARKTGSGITLSAGNLRGCVNDVATIEDCLQKYFPFDELRLLTSSVSAADPEQPRETEGRWPTFYNIKKEFDEVYEHASPGDLFFFHFSGHGTRLKTTLASSVARETDPSLLPMDFCCGQPAIRGWQLNDWLKRYNEKGVRVVVSLDSCYSAGSWRNDGTFRTPKDWTLLPNLPIDKAAVEGTPVMRDVRDGELEVSWDINPDGFTLMAACESNQLAYERTIGGNTCGVFTHAVWSYLSENATSEMMPMYRNIRDFVASKIAPQNPQVFGRDRLAFFGAEELFSAAPLLVNIYDGVASLTIGRVHGVRKGAEFIARRSTTDIVFSVDQVADFESKAKIKEELFQSLPKTIDVVPFRWSSGGMLKVRVESSLGRGFREALQRSLQQRIAGDLQVVDNEFGRECGSSNVEFYVKSAMDDAGVDIFGHAALIGYEGPVRGLRISGASTNERARESAITLAHLFRFSQILDLKSETIEQHGAPFEIILEPRGGPSESPLEDGQIIEYTFKNKDKEVLCLTVIDLGPGFRVRQLFPSDDLAQPVPAGATRSFRFRVVLPERLRGGTKQQEQAHRDIFRTVVTKGKRTSFKSLELPNVWDAGSMRCGERGAAGRHAFLESDFSWWIVDKRTHTRARAAA
ncbi:hypothetical protein DL770_008370 [Monosporascus sp. CRB-9-2]|nr:hypothetical protein DL770_008370 [Monosporascus sp. CRB-9-2]